MDSLKLNQIRFTQIIGWNKPLMAQLPGCSTNPVIVWVFLLARLEDSPGASPTPATVVTLPSRHPYKPSFASVTCVGALSTK